MHRVGGFVLAVVTVSPDGCDSPSLALLHGTSARLLHPSCSTGTSVLEIPARSC